MTDEPQSVTHQWHTTPLFFLSAGTNSRNGRDIRTCCTHRQTSIRREPRVLFLSFSFFYLYCAIMLAAWLIGFYVVVLSSSAFCPPFRRCSNCCRRHSLILVTVRFVFIWTRVRWHARELLGQLNHCLFSTVIHECIALVKHGRTVGANVYWHDTLYSSIGPSSRGQHHLKLNLLYIYLWSSRGSWVGTRENCRCVSPYNEFLDDFNGGVQ